MKRIVDLRFACVIVLLSVGSVLIAQRVTASRSEKQIATARARAASSTFPAFTATLEERLSPPGTSSFVSRRLERSFRSDGSIAEIEETLGRNGKPGFSVRNIYRADGVLAVVRDSLQIVTATRNAHPSPRTDVNRFDPDRACAETFGGISNFRLVSASDSSAGFGLISSRLAREDRGVAATVWRVPALGCLEARRLAEFRAADGAINQSDLTLTGLQMTEPPPQLFSVPATYKLVSPTQSFERLMEVLGTELCANDRKLLALADADYVENQVTDLTLLR